MHVLYSDILGKIVLISTWLISYFFPNFYLKSILHLTVLLTFTCVRFSCSSIHLNLWSIKVTHFLTILCVTLWALPPPDPLLTIQIQCTITFFVLHVCANNLDFFFYFKKKFLALQWYHICRNMYAQLLLQLKNKENGDKSTLYMTCNHISCQIFFKIRILEFHQPPPHQRLWQLPLPIWYPWGMIPQISMHLMCETIRYRVSNLGLPKNMKKLCYVRTKSQGVATIHPIQRMRVKGWLPLLGKSKFNVFYCFVFFF